MRTLWQRCCLFCFSGRRDTFILSPIPFMNCVNCGKAAQENYCPNCGQPLAVKRITLREGWSDFWSKVYGFDGLFTRTLWDLTRRPGVVARQYINGNRVKYYGPIGYFFLMITIFLLVVGMLDINLLDFISQKRNVYSSVTGIEGGDNKLTAFIIDFVSQNIRAMAFLNIPFQAFAARVLFKKSGLNFVENMVVPFYFMGHLYWLTLLSVLLYQYNSSYILTSATGLFSVLYYGKGYSDFIDYQPQWKSFLKGIGVYVGGQAALFLAATIVTVSVLLLWSRINPEILEMIRPSGSH